MTTPPVPAPPVPEPPAAKWTDADLNAQINAVGKREKEAGGAAARAALAQQLGVDPAQLDAKVAEMKELADKDKSAAVKAKEAADAAKAAADTAGADAARLRHTTRIERALIRAGVDLETDGVLDDAAKLVSVDPAADDAAVKAAVESLKARHAGMFAARAPGTSPPPPPTPPYGGTPPPGRGAPSPSNQLDPEVQRQLARRGIKKTVRT